MISYAVSKLLTLGLGDFKINQKDVSVNNLFKLFRATDKDLSFKNEKKISDFNSS